MSDQVPINYWNSWKKIGRYFLLQHKDSCENTEKLL